MEIRDQFEAWYIMLAGLPRHENAKQENIHLLTVYGRSRYDGMCCSTNETAYKETVLVIAPLLCVICDKPSWGFS